jgi:cyclopropane fatty-acyl-phospholipid synthase-like methyltransferase
MSLSALFGGAERLYAGVSPLGEERAYLNLGYWKDDPPTLDAAAEALARLVAETAELAPGQHVLDAGFGFAEQDVFWAERYDPAQIVGVDLSERHVREGRRRVAERGLGGRIELRRGSATELSAPTGTFDRVLALESALHFRPRRRFFEEAFRVLRGGGRLVTTDVLPRAPRGVADWRASLADLAMMLVWSVPPENLVTPDAYAGQLADAGFENARVISIGADVLRPFTYHLRRRLKDPAVARRLGPAMTAVWRAQAADPGALDAYDYVLAVAEKPDVESLAPPPRPTALHAEPVHEPEPGSRWAGAEWSPEWSHDRGRRP